MDSNLKLTHMHDVTLPESVRDKIQREAGLLLAGAAGIKCGAKESLWEHPLETGAQLALGLGVSYLSRGKGMSGRLARGTGTFMGLAFANDVLRNGSAVCAALSDNWDSPRNWNENLGVMERSLGRFTFDTLLFAAAGSAFEHCLQASTAKVSNLKSDSNARNASATLPATEAAPLAPRRDIVERTLEYLGKGERNPPSITDGPLEVSLYLGLNLPAMTAEQQALASARILNLAPDSRGSMGHEKYKARIEFADGVTEQAVVRAFPHGWTYTRRFRQEQSAYHLNRAFEFENGFPVTAPRIYEKEGKLYRGWIQEEIGVPLEFGMRDLAERVYGKGSYENVARLAAENPKLNLQLEQAFIERMILGDTDPHSKNMVLTPELKVQNIDLDCGFHHYFEPGVTLSQAYGINHMLFLRFEKRPISESTLGRLNGFLGKYDNRNGRDMLHGFGLQSSEIKTVIQHTRWFVREGKFPEFRSLEF